MDSANEMGAKSGQSAQRAPAEHPALRIGQSADPDDAFMAWGLERCLAERGLRVDLTFGDIEQLNRSALSGDSDLTAISFAAYAELAPRYRLLRCGSSFGDGYGPIVVGRCPAKAEGIESLAGLRVAIPGQHTTAYLLLRIYASRAEQTFKAIEMPFDRILDAVAEGTVDAGLIIHEGQLTYRELGFELLFDPPARWAKEEELPLPLGGVVVRRGLDPQIQLALSAAFRESIDAAFDNRDEALRFAAGYARDLPWSTLKEYVERYVNRATADMGADGEAALQRLYERATAAGIIQRSPPLDLL